MARPPEPDSLVYVGTWRDAIPRALIIDPILDAVAVRVYMLLLTRLAPQGDAPLPSYEEIARRLGLSRPTVQRALHLLRATRWITQVRGLRGPDGRFIRSAYLLHDEPLALTEAARLDGYYLAYLEGLLNHAHPRVRLAATAIRATIQDRLERLSAEPDAGSGSVQDRLRQHLSDDDGIGFGAADPLRVQAFRQALAALEDCHRGRGDARLHLLADQAVRHAVVMAVDLDVVIDVDPGGHA